MGVTFLTKLYSSTVYAGPEIRGVGMEQNKVST